MTELDATSGFTPSGVLGATLVYPRIRAALVLQLPFFVRADGSVRSRLPSDPMFAGSSIVGESISVHFEIPLMLRFAVEGRPSPRVRLEAGLDYEAWSMQQRFAIHPHGIYIDNVPGIGRYYLSSMYLPRLMQDTVSVHAGGEFEVWKRHLVVRAGYLFETSATPDRGMSVLTADGLRNMICLGVGIQGGPVRIDVGYAHLFTPDRTVTNSESTQLNPIQPPQGVPVGNGTYKIDTDIVAVGLDARF